MSRPGLWGIYLRGLVMGAADVVPGVSGGTVAFVTGIYDRLVNAIRAWRPQLWQIWREEGWRGFWRAVDGAFVLMLVAGIATSIISFAELITWALEHHRTLVMALFFGLVLGSALYLFRQLGAKPGPVWGMLILGCVLALLTYVLRPMELPATLPWLFAGGAIAICAMILPGISGSFILVILGLYEPVLRAVIERDLPTLLVFASGCAVGLLSFSHALGLLLTYWRQPTMAVLTGFLAGSLVMVWPWRLPESGNRNLLPSEYTLMSNEPNQLIAVLALLTLGCFLVLGLDWMARSQLRQR